MPAMRVIVAQFEALDHYVSREFSHVIRQLIDTHGWKQIEFSRLWHSSKSLEETLRVEFDESLKAVLFWEGYDYINARSREVLALDCPKAIFADDLHGRAEEERYTKMAAFLACDVVLSTYADRFEEVFPEVCRLNQVYWVPHSASPEFLIPWNTSAEDSILLSGAINDHYPFRQAAKTLYSAARHAIAYHPHPGYHCGYDHSHDPRVGPGYARMLNHHLAAFADGARYHYLVAKFFEIPATGTLLLADRTMVPSLRRLGFAEGEHYLSVTIEDMEAVIQRVLEAAHRPEIDSMRRRAQLLTWEHHKTTDRAQLIDSLIQGLP
jgi:hypothetical protein